MDSLLNMLQPIFHLWKTWDGVIPAITKAYKKISTHSDSYIYLDHHFIYIHPLTTIARIWITPSWDNGVICGPNRLARANSWLTGRINQRLTFIICLKAGEFYSLRPTHNGSTKRCGKTWGKWCCCCGNLPQMRAFCGISMLRLG